MPVQTLNKVIRGDIYRRTRAAVENALGDAIALIGHCLEFAWQGYRIIKETPGAPRTLIQAGSARWPRVPPELDDGVSATHFAYEWHPDSDVARLVRAGIIPVVRRANGHTAASLPELHVWLGCPETGEIIDFTTGLWPSACRATLGEQWLAPPPPEYLWTFGSRLPSGVSYIADRNAIETVVCILHLQGRHYP